MATLQHTELPDVTVLKLKGSLTMEGLEEVQDQFQEFTRRPGIHMLVDLTALDSASARLTFALSTSARGRPPWNLVVSNVPGPQFPLYMAGAELKANYPVSVITDGVGLNITVMSYQGQMDFGIVADREQMPDVAKLMDWLRVELEALEPAAAAS